MQTGLNQIGGVGLDASVQVAAQRPLVLGNVARGSVGRFRFDYILGEDGKPLVGEDNNTLLRES